MFGNNIASSNPASHVSFGPTASICLSLRTLIQTRPLLIQGRRERETAGATTSFDQEERERKRVREEAKDFLSIRPVIANFFLCS
jgi:hypothetical protein